jgi:hypothetical protein
MKNEPTGTLINHLKKEIRPHLHCTNEDGDVFFLINRSMLADVLKELNRLGISAGSMESFDDVTSQIWVDEEHVEEVEKVIAFFTKKMARIDTRNESESAK